MGRSDTRKRSPPQFRKATEEVKKLNVKRKKITKRVTVKEEAAGEQARKQEKERRMQTMGMLVKEKRIMLVDDNDLGMFNPPEVEHEIFRKF